VAWAGRCRRGIDSKGLHILPSVIDTQVHFREPGQTTRRSETGSRSAVVGGVTAVSNAEHRSLDRDGGDLATRSGAAAIACIAISVLHRGTVRTSRICRTLTRRGVRRRQGVHWLFHRRRWSKTTKSLRRIFAVIRPAPPFMPKTIRLNERSRCRIEGDPRRTRCGARDRGADGHQRLSTSPARAASASTCCTSRPGRRSSICGITRTSRPASDAHHLTLVGAGMLRAARHPRADESTGARGRSPRRHLVRIEQAYRRARLRPRAAHAGGEGKDLSGLASGMTGADSGAGDARPRQCRAVSLAASSISQRRRRGFTTSPARAASRPARRGPHRCRSQSAARPSPQMGGLARRLDAL